jgi:pyruvate/2-oxoglutarate/acetoin dehydrogenase E1 component
VADLNEQLEKAERDAEALREEAGQEAVGGAEAALAAALASGDEEAIAAAEELASQGIDAEVVDLRSLVPLDRQTILESVGRTGRAIVAHAAVQFCGFGAELASMIHEELHAKLKTPVARIGAAYTPVPFAQSLESEHFPDASQIVAAAKSLMAN